MYLLEEGKLDEAEEMIAPLVEVSRISPHEMASLPLVRARIHIVHGEIRAGPKSGRNGVGSAP